MKKVGKNSIEFSNVYINETAVVTGPLEKKGPYGNYFDYSFSDIYCDEKTFEKAEINLVKKAYQYVLEKAALENGDIDFIVAGDLNNQIAVSTYAMRDTFVPFLGTFAACSTITENLILGSMIVDSMPNQKVICISSSHNATSERQFRYPTEYGGQKPSSMTFTTTAAGASLLTDTFSSVRITKATIGKIIDVNMKDAQDMGRVMAPSAAETLFNHLQNFNEKASDYDLIVTGDLSTYGSEIFKECCYQNDIILSNEYMDAGKNLYDLKNQRVFAGGSGCGCITAFLLSYIFEKIKEGKYHKVLVLATGALLNPIMIAQKDTIPCISHGICIERC